MMGRLSPQVQTAIAIKQSWSLRKEFNHTVHIPSRHFDAPRQVFAHPFYLALSSFEFTLEIQSTAAVCPATFVEELEAERKAAIFHFASQVEFVRFANNEKNLVHAHDFALMHF
jgi:hypothetical protein